MKARAGLAPRLSVIVPAYNAESVLPQALAALLASTLRREDWELIVVDDASTDGTPLIAAEFADVVVSLTGTPRGPAYARNRGCEVSSGEILVFVDADVCVHTDALERFDALFTGTPSISAAFGSYDDSPRAPGVVSQFRNLLHHHVHQTNPGAAETFWAGCGAVTREAAFDVSLFDEWHYNQATLEDIDFGRRLRGKGHQILLRPEILCTHLKQWSLLGMLETDLLRRGIPWTRILLQERSISEMHTLNLSRRERLSAIGTTLALLYAATVSALGQWSLLALALMPIVVVVAMHLSFYRLLWRRAPLLGVWGVPLHLLYYLTATLSAGIGFLAHQLLGEPSPPPASEAFAALGIQTWPPFPRRLKDHIWSAASRTSW